MNKTVDLVSRWIEFEASQPDASLEDFFRAQLVSQRKQKDVFPPQGKIIPDINGRLMILIRRIGKYHISYSGKALEGTGLIQMEEFGILVSVFNQGNPIKSEVIFNNLMELSSGTNMLMRMKKRGLIAEFSDKEDKRVKRLRLTAKGEQTLQKAKPMVLDVAQLMCGVISDEEKKQVMQLLYPIQEKFDGTFQKNRQLGYKEIRQAYS